MKPEDQEEELVILARSGDSAAFDELTKSHRPRVAALIRAKCSGVLEHEDIDDLLQETFLRALRNIGTFEWRGPGSFFRWLGGIAVNVAVKSSRRRQRDGARLEQEPHRQVLSHSKAMRRDERFDRLQAAIDTLSPEYRQVLLLVRIEGLPIKEVARRLNKTPNAVSRMILRAGRKLKEVFGDTESLQLPPRALKGWESSHE